MNIEYRVKSNYGSDLWYPVSDDAKFICALCGTKTLTSAVIDIVKHYRPDAVFNQVI